MASVVLYCLRDVSPLRYQQFSRSQPVLRSPPCSLNGLQPSFLIVSKLLLSCNTHKCWTTFKGGTLLSLLFSFLTRLLAARIVWFPSFPSVSSFYHFITQIQILHNSHINFKMTSNSQDDPTSGCYVVFFWVLSRMLEPSQEDRVHRDMWSSNMAWFHDQQRAPDYETHVSC